MPRELVNTPKQIRNRLRRRGKRLDEEWDRYQDVAYGKPIEEWDLEELARGRPRAKDGSFRGLTPRWITPMVIREAKRRLLDHTHGALAGHVDLAVQTIVNLLESNETDEYGRPIVDARTKFAAAQFVIEHIIGKPKAQVEVEATDTVRQFIAAALVLDDGTPAHPVIDGQFTEDEDDGDEEDSTQPTRRRRPAVRDVPEDEVVARRPTRRQGQA